MPIKKQQMFYKKKLFGGDNKYMGYAVNLGSGKAGYSNSFVDILDRLLLCCLGERIRFSRLFVGRFDLDFGDSSAKLDSSKQSVVTLFHRYVKKYLEKKVAKTRNPLQQGLRNHESVKLIWIREYAKNKKYHYHCAIFLDAGLVAKFGRVETGEIDCLASLLEYMWLKACCKSGITYDKQAPYVHVNKGALSCKHIIRANSADGGDAAFRDMFYHLSYFAKVRDKLRNKSDRQGKRLASLSIPTSANLDIHTLQRQVKDKCSR